jgi:8-oxo-dGTP pyrophosphatase MutT (NUDIX family)
VATARRELLEEAGSAPTCLYNLSRLEAFYRHTTNEVVQIPVFAAFLAPSAVVVLSAEHDASEWLPPALARERMSWPRVRREIDDAVALLGSGGAGVLEDVLGIPD